MGTTSFLTSGAHSGPNSINEAIYQLENCSVIFIQAWKSPQDLFRAARVSAEAMTQLDHITNEILRARDTLKSGNIYNGSNLKTHLGVRMGRAFSPSSRAQQDAMVNSGPGNGCLPGVGVPIKFSVLLNKIKHRHHGKANFRIESVGEHIFLINVDNPDQTPDAIVEFNVKEFCQHCRVVAPHI